jgi:hypothetical protein
MRHVFFFNQELRPLETRNTSVRASPGPKIGPERRDDPGLGPFQ